MVYPKWHPVHLAEITRYLPKGRSRARRLIERIAPKVRSSHFDKCDMIVQCGAPVFWNGCHLCEWAEPLWHNVVGRLSQRIPVLNLAAGSCYPLEHQPLVVDDTRDADYLRAILGYCRTTTVRDTLAQRLCDSVGTQVPVIPCSAFLSGKNHEGAANDDGIILINYMTAGGHYDWGQKIDAALWRKTVKTLIGRLQRRHKLAFLCHDKNECNLAKEMDAAVPRLSPKNSQEYFAMVSRAKGAVCNRMHASVALASLGVPSVAVCTDTRLLMVDTLGLPCMYVKEANVESLESRLEDLLSHRSQEKERLVALRTKTWDQYLGIMSDTL